MVQIIFWLLLTLVLIIWQVRLTLEKPETKKVNKVVQAISILVIFAFLMLGHPF